MKDRITVVNEKVDYSKNDHRLYWLKTILVTQEQYHWYVQWCKKKICNCFLENALFKELVDSPQKRTEKTEEVSMIFL